MLTGVAMGAIGVYVLGVAIIDSLLKVAERMEPIPAAKFKYRRRCRWTFTFGWPLVLAAIGAILLLNRRGGQC